MRLLEPFVTSLRVVCVTSVLLGLVYPLGITALAQWWFPRQANGLDRGGQRVGGDLIGQPFVSAQYFHSRPSAAGAGYDAMSSGGSNLGPTNRVLVERIRATRRIWEAERTGVPIPTDLLTASASGLDPHLSPDAIEYQLPRVAAARGLSMPSLRLLVAAYVENRTWGFLGEPRVNVLQLNLALDRATRRQTPATPPPGTGTRPMVPSV